MSGKNGSVSTSASASGGGSKTVNDSKTDESTTNALPSRKRPISPVQGSFEGRQWEGKNKLCSFTTIRALMTLPRSHSTDGDVYIVSSNDQS